LWEKEQMGSGGALGGSDPTKRGKKKIERRERFPLLTLPRKIPSPQVSKSGWKREGPLKRVVLRKKQKD